MGSCWIWSLCSVFLSTSLPPITSSLSWEDIMQNFMIFVWLLTKSPPGAPQLVTSQSKWPSNQLGTLQCGKCFATLQCTLKGSATPYIDFQTQLYILANSSGVLPLSKENSFFSYTPESTFWEESVLSTLHFSLCWDKRKFQATKNAICVIAILKARKFVRYVWNAPHLHTDTRNVYTVFVGKRFTMSTV